MSFVMIDFVRVAALVRAPCADSGGVELNDDHGGAMTASAGPAPGAPSTLTLSAHRGQHLPLRTPHPGMPGPSMWHQAYEDRQLWKLDPNGEGQVSKSGDHVPPGSQGLDPHRPKPNRTPERECDGHNTPAVIRLPRGAIRSACRQ
jgi:hypothetical protein